MIERLKKYRWAQRLKSHFLVRTVQQSVGDWRFPFLLAAWKTAALLTHRRKVSCNGVVFTLPCTNWITHFRWYLFNTKEVEVRKYIDEHVREGDVFFDIGANIGVFSMYAARRYRNISVYAFEPEYSNLNLLKENIYYNGVSGKVTPYGVGISDAAGLSRLHMQDVSMGAAASTESRDQIAMTDEGYKVVFREGIFTLTIDDICEQLGVVPNALKIDTDGNEAKILAGAGKTLANAALRSLVIEIPDENDKGKSCRAVLEHAGFRPSWQDPKRTRNEVWSR